MILGSSGDGDRGSLERRGKSLPGDGLNVSVRHGGRAVRGGIREGTLVCEERAVAS